MDHGSRLALGSLFVAGVIAACSSSASSAPDTSTPDAATDARTPAEEAGGDAGTSSDTIAASEYCESIVDFFCGFYLRCGRMVASDAADCKKVFLETCNARYEPRYVDLEKAGLLTLTRAGVDACSAHLAKVSCAEQASDLDGPCGGMWRGSTPAGGKCGIDVESFVCAPGTACTLSLDFCGTCDVAAPRGGACAAGGTRCQPEDACVGGTCVARALPGEACSDAKPCTVGATCTNGACEAPAIVGEGETCDASHRCAYRAYCSGGKCVKGALLGESCASAGACVSGRCVGGACAPLLDDGQTCGQPLDCHSAQCTSKKCEPLPSGCLAP